MVASQVLTWQVLTCPYDNDVFPIRVLIKTLIAPRSVPCACLKTLCGLAKSLAVNNGRIISDRTLCSDGSISRYLGHDDAILASLYNTTTSKSGVCVGSSQDPVAKQLLYYL